jgi:hypothetical protein
MFGDTPMPELDLRDIDVLSRPVATEVISACAGGSQSPEDAWRGAIEKGLAPKSWLEDRRRRFPDQELVFFCESCNGRGATGYNYDDICNDCDGRGNQMTRGSVALPTDMQQVEWMLGNVAHVEAAEELARESVRRLAKLNKEVTLTDVVQWGRLRKGKKIGTIAVLIQSAVTDLVRVNLPNWNRDPVKSGQLFRSAPWINRINHLHQLSREILFFDVGYAWAHRAAKVVDSPMEPLLDLWELGVVVEEVTKDAIMIDRAAHRYISYWRAGMPVTTTWG